MNLKLLTTMSFFLLPIISACTPGQINEAIESCKGDPECFQIVDNAIEEELAARGITGGRMTNIEMEQVSIFLESFTLGESDNQFNQYKLNEIGSKNYYLGYPSENNILMSTIENLSSDFYNNGYPNLLPNLTIFKIDVINPDSKQLFYTGTGFNKIKHMIYKVGADVFNYEIYGNEEYLFNIQLELESIFFRDKRYISPVSIYKYFEENYPWDEIFITDPFIVNNEYMYLEISRVEDEIGVYLIQRGFSHYMKGSSEYESQLPFFSITYTIKSSGKVYSIGTGYSGSFGSFETSLGFSIQDTISENYYTFSGVSINYKLDDSFINQEITLEDWINYAIEEEVDFEDLKEETKNSILEEIKEVFFDFLDEIFILRPISVTNNIIG